MKPRLICRSSLNISLTNPGSFVDPWMNFPGGNPFPWTAPKTTAQRQALQFPLPDLVSRFFNPDWSTPYNQQWNLSIQRQLPWETILTAAYVGSKGTHLVLNDETNPAAFIPGNGPNGQPLSNTGNINARRLNPNFQGVDEASTDGNSNYNSLQISANRRFVKGLTVLMNYTWSKALDYESLDRNASLPQDPNNLRAEYGPADLTIATTSSLRSSRRFRFRGRKGFAVSLLRAGESTDALHQRRRPDRSSGRGYGSQGGGSERVNIVGNPVLSSTRGSTRSTGILQLSCWRRPAASGTKAEMPSMDRVTTTSTCRFSKRRRSPSECDWNIVGSFSTP